MWTVVEIGAQAVTWQEGGLAVSQRCSYGGCGKQKDFQAVLSDRAAGSLRQKAGPNVWPCLA